MGAGLRVECGVLGDGASGMSVGDMWDAMGVEEDDSVEEVAGVAWCAVGWSGCCGWGGTAAAVEGEGEDCENGGEKPVDAGGPSGLDEASIRPSVFVE